MVATVNKTTISFGSWSHSRSCSGWWEKAGISVQIAQVFFSNHSGNIIKRSNGYAPPTREAEVALMLVKRTYRKTWVLKPKMVYGL